jgi:hypothetical protein
MVNVYKNEDAAAIAFFIRRPKNVPDRDDRLSSHYRLGIACWSDGTVVWRSDIFSIEDSGPLFVGHVSEACINESLTTLAALVGEAGWDEPRISPDHAIGQLLLMGTRIQAALDVSHVVVESRGAALMTDRGVELLTGDIRSDADIVERARGCKFRDTWVGIRNVLYGLIPGLGVQADLGDLCLRIEPSIF